MAKPSRQSAGLLMYRGDATSLEVFLAHPGGPYFAKKDAGSWTVPKGLVEAAETPEAAAQREFAEEIGLPVRAPLIPLGNVTQKGGKQVIAWAFSGNAPEDYRPPSNTFTIEWPPRSGRQQSFPEVDRAEFFPIEVARQKLNPAQLPFIDRLLDHLGLG